MAWHWCRTHGTPKFLKIPHYSATVNCGVYYACAAWQQAMEKSFEATVAEPNDELLWRSVLPADVTEHPEFWWGDLVVNLWSDRGFDRLSRETFFAHVRELSWASAVRARVRELGHTSSGTPRP